MGYVGGILMERRYNNADRDLLLDCAEALCRLAGNVTPVVLGRFQYIRDWLLTGVGTYLLLAGPNPSSPSDSYYDDRIMSDHAPAGRGLKRAEREEWPEILLGEWDHSPDETEAAAYALASVCGWDLARGEWLIERVFEESRSEDRTRNCKYWIDRFSSLLTRVERIRIATNPWSNDDSGSARGSMITSDASGTFRIPHAVLKAAAAQGLGESDVATVHGQLFNGRRVPTYLLTNRFGPYAILKIDRRSKVNREVTNFEEYAKRLHQSHRPSECRAHKMDMYLGEDGAPLRAIETSYVFEERDRPLTMGAWIRESESAAATEVVEDFLLGALRPWIAHVRRDRIDLRTEYPILRAAPAPGKQSPSNWADTEIGKIEGAHEALGIQLDRSQKRPEWLMKIVDESSLAAAELGEEDLVNPLWLACEIAELGDRELLHIVDSLEVGLRDFDTLLCLSHGDLHLDNILCASSGAGKPRTVLIDFESTHYGHVCKDLARLEASVLCQVFALEDGETAHLSRWFADSIRSRKTYSPSPATSDSTAVCTAASVAGRLREIAKACGQGHWPLREDEYLLSLFAALLPMTRYSTLSVEQNRLALTLATLSGSRVLKSWLSMAC
jgi:hypothetical protein